MQFFHGNTVESQYNELLREPENSSLYREFENFSLKYSLQKLSCGLFRSSLTYIHVFSKQTSTMVAKDLRDCTTTTENH